MYWLCLYYRPITKYLNLTVHLNCLFSPTRFFEITSLRSLETLIRRKVTVLLQAKISKLKRKKKILVPMQPATTSEEAVNGRLYRACLKLKTRP